MFQSLRTTHVDHSCTWRRCRGWGASVRRAWACRMAVWGLSVRCAYGAGQWGGIGGHDLARCADTLPHVSDIYLQGCLKQGVPVGRTTQSAEARCTLLGRTPSHISHNKIERMSVTTRRKRRRGKGEQRTDALTETRIQNARNTHSRTLNSQLKSSSWSPL